MSAQTELKSDSGSNFETGAVLKVLLWVSAIVLVSELIGNVTIPLGIGSVVLLPLVWAMILGAAVSVFGPRLPRWLAVDLREQNTAAAVVQTALLIFIAKLSLLVGVSIPRILGAGWALAFQELGHFVGTILVAMPVALLLGIKREAVGATFSVGREPSLAIIAERYGINSPEGRGVMAEYVTGTVVGAIFIAVLASFISSLNIFDPIALAMGSGVGSGSMMAAASGAIAAHQTPEVAKDVQAFAAASNLLTTTIGTYFTLIISLPLANLAYRILEPRIGGRAPAVSTPALAAGSLAKADENPIRFGVLANLVLFVITGIIALVMGNWINYRTPPATAVPGMLVIVAVAIAGELIRRALPLKVPAVIWVSLLGMACTAPIWGGAEWAATETNRVNFLALSTPIIAYAGLSLAKDLPMFRALGWRIVLVSLLANAGTFIGAAAVAQFVLGTRLH